MKLLGSGRLHVICHVPDPRNRYLFQRWRAGRPFEWGGPNCWTSAETPLLAQYGVLCLRERQYVLYLVVVRLIEDGVVDLSEGGREINDANFLEPSYCVRNIAAESPKEA
jgi:hypothetical protein